MFVFEAIFPTEVGLPTICSDVVTLPDENEAQLQRDLDLIEETRDMAAMAIARYQQLTTEYYDS